MSLLSLIGATAAALGIGTVVIQAARYALMLGRRRKGKQAQTVLKQAQAELERERERVRNEHDVRPVAGLEVGAPLPQVPEGVYGFCPPWLVDSLREGGSTGLASSAGGTSVLEVHKLRGEDVVLIVYASAETAFHVRDKSWGGATIVYPDRWDGAREIVSLSVQRIARAQDRSFEPRPGVISTRIDVTVTQGDRRPRHPEEEDSALESAQVLSIREAQEKVSQLDLAVRRSAEEALVAYEVTFDDQMLVSGQRYSDERRTVLEGSASWAGHLWEKLELVGLADQADRGDVARIAARLRQLSMDRGWTPTNALLKLAQTLPAALPVVAYELVVLSRLDARHWLNWRMQVELAGIVAGQPDDLVLRAFGTVLRDAGFEYSNSLVDAFVERARQTIAEPDKFAIWFRRISGRNYEEWDDARRAHEREWLEQSERDRRERHAKEE